jgi:nucleoside-diphosphate-sugar epimerase
VDTRGVRFPGLISYKTLPGGGTTDYAVHIYYEALRSKKYTSYIGPGTKMDMMYMPDALDAIVDLMEADPKKLVHRNAFNVTAMSFAPEDIARSIQKFIPEFELDYDVDPVRQAIAESWPNSLDDSAAREEWGWNPKYDLDAMTEDMLKNLKVKLGL